MSHTPHPVPFLTGRREVLLRQHDQRQDPQPDPPAGAREHAHPPAQDLPRHPGEREQPRRHARPPRRPAPPQREARADPGAGAHARRRRLHAQLPQRHADARRQSQAGQD